MDRLRYKKIKSVVDKLHAPSIRLIKQSRKRRSMPYKDIETILKIFFPRTKFHKTGKGFFKHVFVVHSSKRKLVLKIGRSPRHIRKDHTTYRRLSEKIPNKYFAKIYWADGLFMLQKYGRQVTVPPRVLQKLKAVGARYRLRDVRDVNVMKFGSCGFLSLMSCAVSLASACVIAKSCVVSSNASRSMRRGVWLGADCVAAPSPRSERRFQAAPGISRDDRVRSRSACRA